VLPLAGQKDSTSSEELSQQTFFNLLMAKDGWSKAGSQIIDDLCLVGHFHELSPFLLSEHPIPSLYPFGLILEYFERHHIEVGSKDCPVSVPTPVDGNGTAPINPSDLYTVSRPNPVNVGVIGQ
jgi:hypothetical protein